MSEGIDLGALTAEDVPPITEPQGKPDPEASREPRSRKFGQRRERTQREPRSASQSARARSTAKARTIIPNRKGQFVEPLQRMYAYAGMGLLPLDPVCGSAIIQAAPQCAEAIDDLAYRNEAVRRVVYSIVQASTFGALVAAHLPILVAIASHHVPAFRDNPVMQQVYNITTMPQDAPQEPQAGEPNAA